MLGLEEFKCPVIGNNVYLVTDYLVLPLEEAFQDGDCLHLKYTVVMLSCREFLGHEPSGSTCLPSWALSIDTPNPRCGGVTDEPYGFT